MLVPVSEVAAAGAAALLALSAADAAFTCTALA